MRNAFVSTADRLSCMPDQDVGSQPVIRIIVHPAQDRLDAFYIDPTDIHKRPVTLYSDHPSLETPDPLEINCNDPITFDVQHGFHKAVIWKGRMFIQRGYSFDSGHNTNKPFDGTIYDDHKGG